MANLIQRVDDHQRRALAAVRSQLAIRQADTRGLIQTLAAVGPETVLARGYAVVRHAADRRVIRSVGQVSTGDSLDVRVSDGQFGVEVD